jgi:hypothetical protein
MTYISTVIAKQGIILSADSKETVEGGHLLWDHFDEILKRHDLNEDDEKERISPKEIKDKFKEVAQKTGGRVKSTDGAKKIFQIGSHTALLVAGKANPAGKNYEVIVGEIKDALMKPENKSFTNILNITFAGIEKYINNDTSDGIYETELIFCGLDEKDNKFKVFRFLFNDRYFYDEKKKIKVGDDGKPLVEKFFGRGERTQMLNTGGWTKIVSELGILNSLHLEIELTQAFELSKRIMDLVVTIESIMNSVPGIGGKIYYAAITEKGFYWIESEADIMNLLR